MNDSSAHANGSRHAARRELLDSVRRGDVDIDQALGRLRALTGRPDVSPRQDAHVGPPSDRQWFEPCWEPTELPSPPAVTDSADVLLVLDGPAAEDEAGHLPGAALAVHRPDTPARRISPGVYESDVRSPEGWRSLLTALSADGHQVRRGVLATGRSGRSPAEWLDAAWCAVTSLAGEGAAGPADLACVVPGTGGDALTAALGGFAQIAGEEISGMRVVAVQAAGIPHGFCNPAEIGLAELSATGPGSAEVRYDAEGRWCRTLRPVAPDPEGTDAGTVGTDAGAVGTDAGAVGHAAPSGLPERAVCLVSGGAGGLGTRLALHLAERYAARLVLAGRGPESERIRQTLGQIATLGGSAVYVTADVTRRDEAERAVARAREAFGPVSAVFHLAGSNSDAYLRAKSPAAVRGVLDPKLTGAVNLDEATREEPLEQFVLFSSNAAFLGAPGQSDYAAAGRGLLGLAAERTDAVAAGLRRGRSLAMLWPLWAGGGMDVDDEAKAALRAVTGQLPMPPEVGFAALHRALALRAPALMPAYGDIAHVRRFVADHLDAAGKSAPRAGGAGGAGGAEAAGEAGPAGAPVPDAAPAESEARRWLTEVISEVAKLPPERLGPDDEFAVLGIDSLLVRKVTTVLQKRLGPLPSTLLFEYRTVRELAGRLAATHGAALALPEARPRPRPLPRPLPPETGPGLADGSTALPVPAAGTGTPGRPGEPGADDIAVIGMAGRYPGAEDLDEFWQNLVAGRDCITEIPPERWDADRHFDDGPVRPGRTYGRWGGFLHGIDRFDPLFFSISPREAELMDPQERLFLEAAWHTLEDAGYSRALLHRTTREGGEHRAGVFVGVTSGQYQLIGAEEWGKGNPITPNSSFWSIANRVSYVLDVHGPSLAVDTACSSSLTAIHLACESLRRGECRTALAGGVNLNIHPAKYAALAQLRFLSSDGRCRAFGDGGDGYVPGEGVGAVLLKPLHAALADGDAVRAVIKGTAVNHAGTTNGYTVPGPRAQGSVVREALLRSGLAPGSVSYVEAHGTGTALGDPIEIEGLARALGDAGVTDPEWHCALGSVKSAIGHLESAAGIAGLAKCVLQLEHRTLVPTLHSEPPNRNVDWQATPFRPQRELAAWEGSGPGPLRGGVSSFGAGGANAHMIVEEYVPGGPAGDHGAGAPRRPEVVVVSARTASELRAVARRLGGHLEGTATASGEGATLREVAHTLMTGRDAQSERLALRAATLPELCRALRSFARGDDTVPGRLEPDPDAGPSEDQDRHQGVEGDRERLARRWLTGADVPWEEAFARPAPRRVRLPGYPFGGRRFWVPTLPEGTAAAGPAASGDGSGSMDVTVPADDPLLSEHQVHGRATLPGVAQLTAADAALARSGDGGGHRVLTDIVWREPLAAADDTATADNTADAADAALTFRVTIGPAAPEEGGRRFEVTTGTGEDTVVHAVGHAPAGAGAETGPAGQPPGPLDLDAIRDRCREPVPGDEVYAAAAAAGLAYGPAYRRLVRAWRGPERTETLAELRPLPDASGEAAESSGPAAGWFCHPAVLDGALHALLALGPADETLVPARLGRVELLRPPRGRCLAHARLTRTDAERGLAVCDVVLTDDTGRPCVVFRDFTAARLPGPARPAALTCLTPRWRVRPLPSTEPTARAEAGTEAGAGAGPALVLSTGHDFGLSHRLAGFHGGSAGTRLIRLDSDPRPGQEDFARHLAAFPDLTTVYFLGGLEDRHYPADDLDHLAETQEDGVLALFRLCRALADRPGRGRGLRLLVVTNDMQQTDDERPARNPFAASLVGFTKVAANEFPGLRACCVDLHGMEPAAGSRQGSGTDPAELLTLLEPDRPGEETVLRDGCLLTRVLVPAEPGGSAEDEPPFREGGVYLLAGGAGGLGLEVTRMLTREYRARVVLVGRRPESELPDGALAGLPGAGGEVRYVSADITDPDRMRQVIAGIREREGRLDGVVHAAFDMADRTIARLDEATLRQVLNPKVHGTVALCHALADQPLDLLVFFSSAISFTGAPGQANYAAAATFQDAYARFAAARLGRPVTLFNWGFWGEAGAVATEDHRARMERLGVTPLTTEEGLAALREGVAGPAVQLVPMPLTDRAAQSLGVEMQRPLRLERSAGPSLPGVRRAVGRWLATAEPVPGGEALDGLDRVARNLLVDACSRMGMLPEPGGRTDVAGLAGRLGVAPAGRRLFHALLDMLRRAGCCELAADGTVTATAPGRSADAGAEARRETAVTAGQHPDSAPFLRLLPRCAEALHSVLRGEVPGHQVLFPGGSDELVAGLYRANRRAEHFNALVARSVTACVSAAAGPVAVLEVGAGTGGTTVGVLDALRSEGLGAGSLTYDFTDISPSLVRHGAERLAGRDPFLRGRVLDIEQNLARQGFADDRYDLVVASNVLHATRDMRHSLAQIAALLKPGGLLVVNEVTRVRDFVTLIFGLTEGWWLYEDEDLRLPHSPLLAPGHWRALATEAGFHGFHAFGSPDDGPGADGAEEGDQFVMLASRDGWRPRPDGGPAAPAAGAVVAAGRRQPEPGPAPAAARPPGSATHAPVPENGRTAGRLRDRTVEYVTTLYTGALRLVDEELDPAAPLSGYGSDSLTDMEVTARFESDLGPVPASVAATGATADEVTDALLREAGPALRKRFGLDEADTPAPQVAPAGPATPPATPSPPASSRTATPAPGPEAGAGPAGSGRLHPTDEPIAVVGLAGRYPGAADVDAFWKLLAEGGRAIREIPPSRWSPAESGGTDAERWGAFLDDVDLFDPLLFGVSPREAARIDPQERLFLETVWCAMEDAGYTRERATARAKAAAGTGVGVFAGAMYGPYELLAAERWGRGSRVLASSGRWSIANRTSYCFGFDGPSLAVDTACSSSLTAIHLACESLRRGECGMAVAGGVNLILHPGHHLGLSRANMLSPSGRSRAFSAAADGFVTGEGVGAVLLKPLSQALRDRDRIHGCVIGSGLNSNGVRDHFAAPHGGSQQELIERTLRGAGADPRTIQYVEAQAVGSPVSDPVEVRALTEAYRGGGAGQECCAIGSLKPNIGHLEAASGIAQLTKVLLQLRHAELAPTLDGEEPHPDIDFDSSPFRPVRERLRWPGPPGGGPRRAALSSFGAGGANGHLIVEEAPPPTGTPPPTGREQVFVLSARRPGPLRELADALRTHSENGPGDALAPADIARTLQRGREALRFRLAVVARGTDELAARLSHWLATDGSHPPSGVFDGAAMQETATETRGDGPSALAARWVRGAHVDWDEHGATDGRVVSLPHYPFARERYWLDDAEGAGPPGTAAPGSRPDPGPRPNPESRTDPESRPDAAPVAVRADDGPGLQVHQQVTEAIGAVLGVSRDDIDLDDSLSDYGFDSVSVTELAARLRETHGLDLSPAQLYTFRSVRDLVQALGTTPARPVLPAAPRAPLPATGPHVPDHPSDANADAGAIAIIGMAGAFPGSPDLGAFWRNTLAGRDAVTEIPAERFDWRDIHGDPGTDPSRVATRWGGFLDGIASFDPAFFRISPREARLMDPQHRLFLQTVWHTVEDAGYDPGALAGSATGVFAGVASTEYGQLLQACGAEIDGQAASGTAHSILVNRVSYLLDLRGPSEPVDTACSSSLVAVHRAIRAIQDGECELALAGGVNLILGPAGFLAFGKSGMLSADGRCKTFDERADGYARGEGVGAVLLKPLSRALADGDHIYASIRGTAVGHGGRAASLTAPNSAAQAEVIARAWRHAGVPADSIGFIEAHGTGTELGDPVEVEGLRAAFAELGVGDRGQFCGLSTVKTGIGHLETAAGIAGLIRTVLALHHRMLPPLAGFERLNGLIELAGSPFYLVDRVTAWDAPRDEQGRALPRRAGVSSFGFGGVNAHLALEEHPPPEPTSPAAGPAGPGGGRTEALVLSARTADRLRQYAQRLLAHLEQAVTRGAGAAPPFADIAYTLQVGRPALAVRCAVLAPDVQEAIRALRAYLAGEEPETVLTGDAGERAATERIVGGRTAVDELARTGDIRRLAGLWVRGCEVDWTGGGTRRGRRVRLPGYPFATDPYWLPEAPAGTRPRAAEPATPAAVPAAVEAPAPAPVAAAVPAPPAVAPTTQQAAPATQAGPAATVTASSPQQDPGAERTPPASDKNGATEQVHGVVSGIIAEHLGVPQDRIEPDGDFTAYGVDSITGLRIMQAVQRKYGDHIPMLTIVEHPTVNGFVAHLTSEYLPQSANGTAPAPATPAPTFEAAPAPTSELAPAEAFVLADGPAQGTPRYCVHGDTGELTWAMPLLDRLAHASSGQGPLLGLEAASFGTDTPPAASVEELARSCVRGIRAHAGERAVRLAGHGPGSVIAIEAARQLLDAGTEVAELLLVDAEATPGDGGASQPIVKPREVVASVAAEFGAAWGAPGGEPELPVRQPLAEHLDTAARHLSRGTGVPLPAEDLRDWVADAVTHRRAFRNALHRYTPRPLAGAGTSVVWGGSGDWSRWLVPPPRTDFPSPREPDVAPRPARRAAPAAGIEVVAINRDGPREPSFWGHTLLGDVSYGLSLSRHLGLPYPVFGLEQFASDGNVRVFETVEELASTHIRAMRRVRPHGPYTLGGYSLGGIAVYEMARQLLQEGEEVRHLTLIDAIMPGTDAWDGIDAEAIEGEDFEVMSLVLIANALGRRWDARRPLSLEDIAGLDREQQIDAVAAHVTRHSRVDKPATDIGRLVRASHEVILGNNSALERYRPKPLARPVDTLLFHATLGHVGPDNPNDLPEVRRLCDDRSNGFDPFLGGRLDIVDVPADHFTICNDDHIRTVADGVRTAWRAADN